MITCLSRFFLKNYIKKRYLLQILTQIWERRRRWRNWLLHSMSDNWASIVTLSLSRESMKKGLLRSTSAERERKGEGEERSTFIYVKSKTDRKRGNHSYRNVNNNNHNNSLLFSRRLFDAAFSSEREWVERVEPHPLRAPFFLRLYHHCHLHPHLFLPSSSLLPPRLYNPLPHFFARNIHWRLRYRLCALRRSRKSRMNRASFRDVPRALFPSKLSCAKKNANNVRVYARWSIALDSIQSCEL